MEQMEKERQFIKIYDFCFNTNTYTTKSGDVVKLTLSDKFIYSYMLSQYQFFKSVGNNYYASQKTISLVVSCSVKTVNECIVKLTQLGVIETTQQAGKNNVYVVNYLDDVLETTEQEKCVSKLRTTSYTKNNYTKNTRNTPDNKTTEEINVCDYYPVGFDNDNIFDIGV